MPNPNIKGTHFKGPLLSADNAGGGFYRDMPLSVVERSRSPYKIFYENFEQQMADGSTDWLNLELSGATFSDKATNTNATAVIGGANNYLKLFAGDDVDSGNELQFIKNSAETGVLLHSWQILGPITSTTTLMDKKEIFWEARVGVVCTNSADFTGSLVVGWVTTDTDIIEETTGAIQIADGGGFGFYASGDVPTGELGFFSEGGTIAAGNVTDTASINVVTDVAAAGADVIKWYKLGARMLVNDASAFTGVTRFYVDDKLVGTINDATCMDSTEVYSFTAFVINGPGTDDAALCLDYVMTGITRDGLTYPYSDGVYF